MAGTFSKIYIQLVFAVKGRQHLLLKDWRADVFKYISGIITEKNQKSINVNGVSDHIHVFAGMLPSMSVVDLARDLKNNSSNYINRQNWLNQQFSWQAGYGAFFYSRSQLERI